MQAFVPMAYKKVLKSRFSGIKCASSRINTCTSSYEIDSNRWAWKCGWKVALEATALRFAPIEFSRLTLLKAGQPCPTDSLYCPSIFYPNKR